MSGWATKRFWKTVTVVTDGDGYGIELDGRPVRTPAKAALILPTTDMAQAAAAEWEAQQGKVDPRTMPVTRSANAAIDKVRPQQGEVADMLAAYGDSDLLCYRAEAPEALRARQAAAWDPALHWAESALGVRLMVRAGVMYCPQDQAALDRLAARVHAFDPFRLAALHDLVSLSGSLILGLAAADGWRDALTVWDLSRVDETWQQEQWGVDEEAAAAAEIKRQSFLHAKRFFDLCGKLP